MNWFTPIIQAIPHNWKVGLQATRRRWQDQRSGVLSLFATEESTIIPEDWSAQIHITQELKPSAYAENKRHNLAIAIQQMESIVILPGQIFSFWHGVGQPTERRGYLTGRALMNNQLKAVVGGGLCQLSGLIYLLALHTDFDVLERHAHSKDIYTDETRFAPLGSDATVVYGYKDLRIQNQTSTPVRFQFHLDNTYITATILAIDEIPKYDVEFLVSAGSNQKSVRTIRHRPSTQSPEFCHTNVYAV
jgi:vancomycin resistance protein VanW